MLDLIASFIASLAVSMLLRKKTSSIISLGVAVAVGALIGWQALHIFPAENTSLRMILQIEPSLQVIYDQTQSLQAVISFSRYGTYIFVGLNMATAFLGYYVSGLLHRKKQT